MIHNKRHHSNYWSGRKSNTVNTDSLCGNLLH